MPACTEGMRAFNPERAPGKPLIVKWTANIRLLDGEAIPRDEWNAVRYAYFASLKDY
jgi:hypothetical protein